MRPSSLAALLALAAPALTAQGGETAAAGLSPKGVIAVGGTVRDSLGRGDVVLPAESTHAQAWWLSGTAGETITLDLISQAFDAYVFLLGPGLEGELPQDDDSGGDCNARLTVRLPRTGTYQIVVTSTDKFATGPFTLSVTAGARPKSLSPCRR